MRSAKDGLRRHAQSIKSGFTLSILTCNQLIHRFSIQGLIGEAQKLFDEMPERNVFSWNTIIAAHIKTQNLTQAKAMFDCASVKDSVTYNTMISGYANADRYGMHALDLFDEMQSMRHEIEIDEFTLTTMVNLSAKMSMLSCGRQLHLHMMKTANDKSGFAVSALIDMYSKCGCFEEAWQVFKGCEGVGDLVSRNAMVAAACREGEIHMALKLFWRGDELNDIVSWNTLISGYVQNGYVEEALELFVCMRDNGVKYNEHTFASILNACSSLGSFKLGKEVHARALKHGLISNSYINSGIIDVYCKCGNMKYAESTHSASGNMSSFSITSVIVGHSMQGNMAEARRFFDSLAEKNSVVWTALFSGYVKSQQSEAVFKLLTEFVVKEAVVPDALIIITVLNACALQAALSPGKQIHNYVFRMGIEMDEKLITAMVDMYSKCGSVTYAEKIFQRVNQKDSVLYNVMIAGYAHHGHENESIHLFQEMLEKGMRPDAVTFLALLSACRHSGSVESGEKIFYYMTEHYNILPETDHYACMIDLYGRSLQLEKAVAFLKQIPVEEQNSTILGTFLNACRLNRNAELAREVEDKLLKTQGDSGARLVQLANVYAAEGSWAEMGRVRKLMKVKQAKKFAGCSWVYVDNGVHIFTSGDRSHSKEKSIYSMLASLTAELYEIEGAFSQVANFQNSNQKGWGVPDVPEIEAHKHDSAIISMRADFGRYIGS